MNNVCALAHAKPELDCSLAGEKYKWASERTSVFDATSNPAVGKIIDYLAIKDADEPNELVVFFAFARTTNAFYQVPSEGVICMRHSRVWKAVRRSKRLDAEGVVCKVIKQLAGHRAVDACWGDQVFVIKYKYKSNGVGQVLTTEPHFYASGNLCVRVCVCFPFFS